MQMLKIHIKISHIIRLNITLVLGFAADVVLKFAASEI